MEWVFGQRRLLWSDPTVVGSWHPSVMGILNVTPDSFYDGGHHEHIERALARARLMADQGAAIIDIGGESTRPGAQRVSADEEARRVIPIIKALSATLDVAISVDTSKAKVAALALEAGADIVNDVTALTGDPGMIDVLAQSKAGVILMHMRGTPLTMQQGDLSSDNIVEEVGQYLSRRLSDLDAAGISRDRVCLDPGIGFGKTCAQNLQLLVSMGPLRALGRPLLSPLADSLEA